MKNEKKFLYLETAELDQDDTFSFAEYSSIGVGGSVKAAFYPKTIEETVTLVGALQRENVDFTVLGNATNVLPSDGDSESVVLSTKKLVGVEFDEDRVFAYAGTDTKTLLDELEKHALSGAEFLEGIPATVGGAAYMNAGALGRRLDEIVESVLVYKGGKVQTLRKSDCAYAYKSSVFMNDDAVILGVNFLLQASTPETVAEKRKACADTRKALPVGKSMGCVFKNPASVSAGKLIEGAGLKGFKIGGAYISSKHANFIINGGTATAKDIRSLINMIKSAVFSQYGIRLEEEIRYLR
ncbi:MAG: UDP-N-acetylmuramate dehydrogenase [Clostridia bacterium]|nr:UDP-N-acetylmuramate dehydrogenase [Clostridia bacterium]